MKYMASTSPTMMNMMVNKPALGFWLTGNTGDGLATGQAVADGGADSTAAEGKPATDHGAGKLYRLVEVICHWGYLLPF